MLINWGFEGVVVPKARARTTRRGTYHIESYQKWKEDARRAIEIAISKMPATESQHFPLSGVGIEIEFYGNLAKAADLDNAVGSWLDALVVAGVLKGDSRSHVLKQCGEWVECDRPHSIIRIWKMEVRRK